MTYGTERYSCPDCGSSDGLAVDHEKSTAYCHACTDKAFKGVIDLNTLDRVDVGTPAQGVAVATTPRQEGKEVYKAFPDRGITVATAKAYSTPHRGSDVVFKYGTAEKVRFGVKDFRWTTKNTEGQLFGQDKFAKGQRTLTITEGEYDAMAAYQMQGSKYPVVSIPNGANSALKDCKAQFDYINSFDSVIISFDTDAPGIKAANEVAALFPDKAKILKHREGFKDACDYLKDNYGAQYVQDWWRAEEYMPDGIVRGNQLHDEVMADVALPFCRYPWDCLNLMLYGMRKGEIVTLTAGTGVGKTTVVKQIEEEVFKHTEEIIGVLSLEESVATSGLSLMSLSANKPLHLPTKQQMVEHILKDPENIKKKPKLADTVTAEEKEEAYEAILNNDRFLFLRHEGRLDMDSVLSKIRYLAKAKDCGVVVLDHISILVGMSTKKGNEREIIDDVMHSLRAVVEETGILLLCIHHLSKTGTSRAAHEEGGRVQLGDLRGSNSIAQLSNIAIALEGNRQADTDYERNITTVRIIKNRFSGETGVAGHLHYSLETGRLTEVELIDLEEAL